MRTMTTTRRRPYILPEAFDQLREDMSRGYDYNAALINVAIRFGVASCDLREAYEARRRFETLTERAFYLTCAAAVLAVVLTY